MRCSSSSPCRLRLLANSMPMPTSTLKAIAMSVGAGWLFQRISGPKAARATLATQAAVQAARPRVLRVIRDAQAPVS